MSKIKMEQYDDLVRKFSFDKSEFYWLVVFLNEYGPPKKFVGIKIHATLNKINLLQKETSELTIKYECSKSRCLEWKIVSWLFPINIVIYFFLLFSGRSFREQIFLEKKKYKNYLSKLTDVRQKLVLLEMILEKLIKTNDNEIPTYTQCEKEYPEYYKWEYSVNVACSLFSQMARIGDSSLVRKAYLSSFTGSSSQNVGESFMDFVSMQLDLLTLLKNVLPKEEMESIQKALMEEKEKRAQYQMESMSVLQICKKLLAPEDYQKVVQGLEQINNHRSK